MIDLINCVRGSSSVPTAKTWRAAIFSPYRASKLGIFIVLSRADFSFGPSGNSLAKGTLTQDRGSQLYSTKWTLYMNSSVTQLVHNTTERSQNTTERSQNTTDVLVLRCRLYAIQVLSGQKAAKLLFQLLEAGVSRTKQNYLKFRLGFTKR